MHLYHTLSEKRVELLQCPLTDVTDQLTMHVCNTLSEKRWLEEPRSFEKEIQNGANYSVN